MDPFLFSSPFFMPINPAVFFSYSFLGKIPKYRNFKIPFSLLPREPLSRLFVFYSILKIEYRLPGPAYFARKTLKHPVIKIPCFYQWIICSSNSNKKPTLMDTVLPVNSVQTIENERGTIISQLSNIPCSGRCSQICCIQL
jgi:hypothetical protein